MVSDKMVVGDGTGTTHRLNATPRDIALHDPDTHAAGRGGGGLDLVEPQRRAKQPQDDHACCRQPAPGRVAVGPSCEAFRSARTPQAMSWPISATTNETTATPMIGKNPASGVSTAAYAIRVQPNPPNGIREYAYSMSTQQQAVARGHQRSRSDPVDHQPEQPEEQRHENDQRGRDPGPEHVHPADGERSASPGRTGSRDPRRGSGRVPRTTNVKAGMPIEHQRPQTHRAANSVR